MSRSVQTEFARFWAIIDDGKPGWLFECPGCGTKASLNADQWNGRISVDHSASCMGGYHQTHDFATALRSADPAAQGIPP